MTMTQEAPANITPADNDAVPGYQLWCPQCYTEGIERLCHGFTIEAQQAVVPGQRRPSGITRHGPVTTNRPGPDPAPAGGLEVRSRPAPPARRSAVMASTIDPAGLNDEELRAAARELGKRELATREREEAERAQARQAAKDAAWARTVATIKQENPKAADLTDDELWDIFFTVRDYYEDWSCRHTEPIPVGTLVDYHGSGPHGRYVITQHEPVRAGVPDPDVHYPDGVGYVIWPEGMPQKFGLREHMISQVRRASLTVVNPEDS